MTLAPYIYANFKRFFHSTRNFLFVLCNSAALDEREDGVFGFIVNELGGWPMINQNWDNRHFDVVELLGRLRPSSYGSTPFIVFYVSVDERNSSYHRILVGCVHESQTGHIRYFVGLYM